MTSRTRTRTVAGLFGIACLGHSICAFSAKGGEDNGYDRLSGEVLAEALIAREPQEFYEPPGQVLLQSPSGGTGARPTFSLVAGLVPISNELGASRDFAGNGSGFEVGVGVHSQSGWSWSAGWFRASEGIYSDVDRRPAAIEHYLIGVSYARVKRRGIRITPGAGLAWNRVDIESKSAVRDIEGPGGYLGLRVSLDLAARLQIGAGGKLILWRGKDGLGNTASEMSLMAGLDVCVHF